MKIKTISYIKLKSPSRTLCSFQTIGNERGEILYDTNLMKKEIIVEIGGEKYRGMEILLLRKMNEVKKNEVKNDRT